MKSNARNIGLFLFLIFLIITIPLVYSLYNLQSQLAIDLNLSEDIVKTKTDTTILRLIGFFIVELLIAGGGVFFILRQRDTSEYYDLESLLDHDNLGNNTISSLANSSSEPDDSTLENEVYMSLETKISKLKKTKDLKQYCQNIINLISKELELSQGAFFIAKESASGDKYLEILAGYAYYKPETGDVSFSFGEGLAGQVAKAQKTINIKDVPEGYVEVISGLGNATPNFLLITPVVHKGKTLAVMELASFKAFTQEQEECLNTISSKIGSKIAPSKDSTPKDKEA